MAHIMDYFDNQKKGLFIESFFSGGPGETRTLTPKALDPKSSASTNFATGPLFNFQTEYCASTTSQKLTFS